MELYKKVSKVDTKEDMIIFVEALIKDLSENSDEWENKSLADYLSGMKSWMEDMDGYYKNNKIPIPENVNWGVFANILYAAKMYE